MKLSFSTRGWDAPWNEYIETALDMRFSGVEDQLEIPGLLSKLVVAVWQ